MKTNARIKKNTCITIFAIISSVFALIFILIALFGLSVYDRRQSEMRMQKGVTQIKIGEKIKFESVNPDFKDIVSSFKGDAFDVRYQGAANFNDLKGEKQNYSQLVNPDNNRDSDEWSPAVFVDSDGYLNAVKSGLYRFEYTIARQVRDYDINAYYDRQKTYTFVNTVAVYENDTDKYQPFPDSYNKYSFNPDGKYILTHDIDIDESYREFLFNVGFGGILINPYGYTVTIDGGKCENGALFGVNYGIINGIKVDFVSSDTSAFNVIDFYGLVKENRGVINDCGFTGDIYVRGRLEAESYDYGRVSLIAGGGIVENNSAEVSVYADGTISPFEVQLRDVQTENLLGGIRKDNKITISAYYFSDILHCRRRNIQRDYSWGTENGNEIKINPDLPVIDNTKTHVVKLKVPEYDGNYLITDKIYLHNSALELDIIEANDIFLLNREGNADNLELEYWLVDGEKYESLDGLVVDRIMTIEPCVKYKETVYVDDILHGADEVLRLDDVSLVNAFTDFFENPHNVVPTKIILGKNTTFYEYETQANSKVAENLARWISRGGVLEVLNGNRNISLVDRRMLCTADGEKLLHYFALQGETEAVLNPYISVVKGYAFVGNIVETIDLKNAREIDEKALVGCNSVKKLILGEDFVIGNRYNYSYDGMPNLLSCAPTIEQVIIDKDNRTYSVDGNFIIDYIQTGVKAVSFVLPAETDKVVLPTGVNIVRKGAFSQSKGVTEIVFSAADNLTVEEDAFMGLEKLSKITFGEIGVIKSSTGYEADLPSLKELVFNDVTHSLAFTSRAFRNADIEKIVLPANLSEVEGLPACAGYEISADNERFFVDDGVLYETRGGNLYLASYPVRKAAGSYTVKDGTKAIGSYAFDYAQVKKVICPESLTQIGGIELSNNGFYGSKIESIEFRATGEINIGGYAFAICAKLNDISIVKGAELNVYHGAFAYCESLREFPYEKVKYIGDSAFYGAGVEYFEFGGNIEYLGAFSFKYSALKSAVFTGDRKYLPGGMFENGEIESVELGNIQIVGAEAFQYCNNLTDVLGVNVTTVREYAFSRCGVKAVNFPDVTEIGAGAFSSSNVETVRLPSVAAVPEVAFNSCLKLKSVALADRVTVDKAAFANCIELAKFDSVITDMSGNSASEVFRDCAELKNLSYDFGDGKADFGENCFAKLKGLEELSVSAGTVVFGKNALSDCVSLKKVTVKESGSVGGTIEADTFAGVTQSVDVYLNVSDSFIWKGFIKNNFRVYVPFKMTDKVKAEWYIDESQVFGYDFTA